MLRLDIDGAGPDMRMAQPASIWCERGGREGPNLVLLHGIGGNGAVWDGLKPILEREWPGRWIIPDFRGHGRSFHRAPYGIGIHAADVAALFKQDEEVTIIGHSLGAIVTLALASGMFGIRVRRGVAFSVKPDWTEEDRVKGDALARAPAKRFETREEAIDRYLRVSGLKGLVGPTAPAAAAGIAATQDGGFTLAADMGVFSFGQPDFEAIARSARAPVRFFCGDQDEITSPQAMQRLGSEVTTLPGLHHNLHVEAPEVFWRAIRDTLR
jgi:pimeloyl-ACP methyl ester carboxylesterase